MRRALKTSRARFLAFLKMTPLLSGRSGRGGGWNRQRTATTPNPSLPRRGIIFTAGGEPKDDEFFARDDRPKEVFTRTLKRQTYLAQQILKTKVRAQRVEARLCHKT